MIYLLDTNIVLAYLKKSALAAALDKQYKLLSEGARPFISAVTVGELWSLCLQNNWGSKRRDLLLETLRQLTILDINIEPIVQNYAEIDAYSQNRLIGHQLSTSARNMGKMTYGLRQRRQCWTRSLLQPTKILTICTGNSWK